MEAVLRPVEGLSESVNCNLFRGETGARAKGLWPELRRDPVRPTLPPERLATPHVCLPPPF
jgi:hypothetical protein